MERWNGGMDFFLVHLFACLSTNYYSMSVCLLLFQAILFSTRLFNFSIGNKSGTRFRLKHSGMCFIKYPFVVREYC